MAAVPGARGAPAAPRPVAGWLVLAAALTVFGLSLAATRVLISTPGSPARSWGEALPVAMMDMYSWGLTGIAAIWLARKIPLDRFGWTGAALLHLVTGIVVLALRYFLGNGIAYLVGYIPAMATAIRFVQILPMNLLSYTAMVGAGYAFEFYRKFRDRELEAAHFELTASQLQTELVQAQLSALKVQLQPHFLFNALNAISSLVQTDQERADRMIASLSTLLRNTLAHQEAQEVTLREEVELLEPYLEIEQMRFGERLCIGVSLAPETLDACIPHLLLQPLMENAIRHGIAPRRGPGRVEVSSRREGARLVLEVKDDGLGLRPAPRYRSPGEGIGLANVRTRLQRLYGADHELRIENRPEGGAVVHVSVPFREEPAPE